MKVRTRFERSVSPPYTACTPAAGMPACDISLNAVRSMEPYSMSPHSWSWLSRPCRSPYLRVPVSSSVLGSTVARQAAT